MRLVKRIGASCLLLCIVFTGTAGISPRAALDEVQAMGRQEGLLPGRIKAVENSEGITDSTGNYKYTINGDGKAKITKYLKEEKEVTVPPMLDGHPVTVIGREAFDLKRSVTSIELPGTVTDIEGNALSRTGIKEFTVPESVLRIGEQAFWYCHKLERIFISQNVEEIKGNIVEMSNILTKIDVDPHNAAYTSMDGILYNKDMTEILAVPGGKDLTGFQFPDSVVCIGEEAFGSCDNSSFTEMVIPDRVTILGRGAFSCCRSLEKVVIGKGVEEIPGTAFFGCGKLSEAVIKGNMKSIGNRAFYECYTLSEINIPDSVVEIGEDAFGNCYSLKNITLPKSVVKIGEGAFRLYEDEPYSDVSITGYRDTAACQYAKEHYIVFQDIETGETIHYDLLPMPWEKIKKLAAGKKKIRLKYKEVEGAFYQIAVKKSGASSWKKYRRLKPSAVIKKLESGKRYQVKVRAVRELGGEDFFGEWSMVRKVRVR